MTEPCAGAGKPLRTLPPDPKHGRRSGFVPGATLKAVTLYRWLHGGYMQPSPGKKNGPKVGPIS